jgi:GDPmannose 4,6-dehydratase
MYLMLQQEHPDDFVIATGKTICLSDFIAEVFGILELNWQEHVISEQSLYRPTDITISRANPNKANQQLGWYATTSIQKIVQIMVESMQRKLPSQ